MHTLASNALLNEYKAKDCDEISRYQLKPLLANITAYDIFGMH